MSRRLFLLLLSHLALLSTLPCVGASSVEVKASNYYPVHNINTGLNYASIQAGIDASETLDGHTIFVEARTYYENVSVHKSLSLIGERRSTTFIDGNGTGVIIDAEYNITAIVHVVADNVVIRGFTVTNGGFHGMLLDCVSNCTINDVASVDSFSCITLTNSNNNCISNSKFSNGSWGIFLFNSTENEIAKNVVSENLRGGIGMGGPEGSSKNVIANNTVSSNVLPHYQNGGFGLDLVGSDNKIFDNSITNNNNGIILDLANRNQIEDNVILNSTYFGIRLCGSSSNNTIFGNTAQECGLVGLVMDFGMNNIIHHNNFVDNKPQVDLVSYRTVWDDGIEGNYWNNNDGIGDTAYTIYEHYRDHLPLVGKFSAFNTVQGDHVNVISNSTIEDFEYCDSNNTIKMLVSNTTVDQDLGFCRISIPHSLIDPSAGPLSVFIDEGQTPALL